MKTTFIFCSVGGEVSDGHSAQNMFDRVVTDSQTNIDELLDLCSGQFRGVASQIPIESQRNIHKNSPLVAQTPPYNDGRDRCVFILNK